MSLSFRPEQDSGDEQDLEFDYSHDLELDSVWERDVESEVESGGEEDFKNDIHVEDGEKSGVEEDPIGEKDTVEEEDPAGEKESASEEDYGSDDGLSNGVDFKIEDDTTDQEDLNDVEDSESAEIYESEEDGVIKDGAGLEAFSRTEQPSETQQDSLNDIQRYRDFEDEDEDEDEEEDKDESGAGTLHTETFGPHNQRLTLLENIYHIGAMPSKPTKHFWLNKATGQRTLKPFDVYFPGKEADVLHLSRRRDWNTTNRLRLLKSMSITDRSEFLSSAKTLGKESASGPDDVDAEAQALMQSYRQKAGYRPPPRSRMDSSLGREDLLEESSLDRQTNSKTVPTARPSIAAGFDWDEEAEAPLEGAYGNNGIGKDEAEASAETTEDDPFANFSGSTNSQPLETSQDTPQDTDLFQPTTDAMKVFFAAEAVTNAKTVFADLEEQIDNLGSVDAIAEPIVFRDPDLGNVKYEPVVLMNHLVWHISMREARLSELATRKSELMVELVDRKSQLRETYSEHKSMLNKLQHDFFKERERLLKSLSKPEASERKDARYRAVALEREAVLLRDRLARLQKDRQALTEKLAGRKLQSDEQQIKMEDKVADLQCRSKDQEKRIGDLETQLRQASMRDAPMVSSAAPQKLSSGAVSALPPDVLFMVLEKLRMVIENCPVKPMPPLMV